MTTERIAPAPATAAAAPPTLRAVIARVQAFVRAGPRGKKRQIAAAARLAPNTLARVEAPGWRPSLDTLERIEALIPPEFIGPPVAGDAEDRPPL